MFRNVPGDLAVRDPQAGQLCFAAENNGLVASASLRRILFPAHCEVYFDIPARAVGLHLEVVGKMRWIFPVMAVDVNQHSASITQAAAAPQAVLKKRSQFPWRMASISTPLYPRVRSSAGIFCKSAMVSRPS